MNNLQAVDLIRQLTSASGAPGFEKPVGAVIEQSTQGLGQLYRDKMNNLYLDRSENRGRMDEAFDPFDPRRPLRVQLDAHQDEVAFMVHQIRPNGTLTFVTLGGWVTSNIPAHRVRILTRFGDSVLALTTSKPPHFMTPEERLQPLDLSQVVLDVGCETEAEVRSLGIQVGDPVVPDVEFIYDEKRGLMNGKAFDCRSGCAAIVDTLQTLKGETLEVNVYGAFSTQEEMGCRGAEVTCQRVKPDLAIVFEGCPADDTFGQPWESQTKLGHGPMLRAIDARMITHPGFQQFALSVAEELGIPVQVAVRTGGSTNGAPIHLSNQGVPCIVIGLPVRYIHTHYGWASIQDHHHAVQLAVALLRRLGRAAYQNL